VNEAIEQEEYRGFQIKIYPELDSIESPREWDNLGTMICFHKRYDLGDKHNLRADDFNGWDEIERHLEKEEDAAIILPLYLYDHSGITMRTHPFSCPWDSGRVGVIYISKDKIRKEYSVKRISKQLRQRVEKYLVGEVETYDRFLTGQVYGFVIEDADGEQFDSCWGYYEEPADIIKECKSTFYHHIEALNKEKHYPKVEVFVTKTQKFRARIRESVELPSYEVSIGGEEWGKGKGRNHEKEIIQQMNSILATLNGEFVANSASMFVAELEGIKEWKEWAGKSQITKEVAEKLGIPVVDVPLKGERQNDA